MKGLTPEERRSTLPAFVDEAEVDLTLVDRTPLERYAVCPAQAIMIDRGGINDGSLLADAGNEGHTAFAESITEYINQGGQISVSDLADTVWHFLINSRPDVQAEAIKGLRASVWAFAKFIAGGSLHPHNIIRYSGGEGKKSGQLAMDWPDLGIRITSELDLLHATASVEQLAEVDFKTGNKIYSSADVAQSFQFQLHAVLVFHNYPGVKSLLVRVWNTRVNRLTWTVEFTREQLPQLEGRVRQAARQWRMSRRYVENKTSAIPDEMYWPAPEKCVHCDAILMCRFAGNPLPEVVGTPGEYLDRAIVVEAGLKKMKAVLGAIVDKTKQDIVSPSGAAFGYEKPKDKKRPAKAIYRVSVDADEPDTLEEAE